MKNKLFKNKTINTTFLIGINKTKNQNLLEATMFSKPGSFVEVNVQRNIELSFELRLEVYIFSEQDFVCL